jgi:hypothetical protein
MATVLLANVAATVAPSKMAAKRDTPRNVETDKPGAPQRRTARHSLRPCLP